MSSDLSPRSAAVLQVVVRHFIAAGQPVSSSTVARDLDEPLSSATVRNVMAELERDGYLTQPHTSAGRRPTASGYLAYVQHLIRHGRLQRIDEESLRERLGSGHPELEAVLQRACSALSELTRHVGVVLAPAPAEARIRHIDLVRQGTDRVSVVFVTGGGMVHTRTIGLADEVLEADLESAVIYLLRRFTGSTLRELRREIDAGPQGAATRAEGLALRLVRQSVGKTIDEAAVLVEGTFHLLDSPELAERATLPSILAAFEERRQLGRLLTRCSARQGPQVLIGRDGLPESLGGCALVAAGYSAGSRPLGVLGVFGPARMEYHRTIPMVETMARVTGDLVTRLCA